MPKQVRAFLGLVLCRAVCGRELKFSLFSSKLSRGKLLCLLCILQYTTARLQVLFSLRHLGRITKGCSNNYDSKSLLYIYIYYTTQLYSNLVYNEHDTTYLCLVLDVLVSPKISRFRLASLCTLLLSPVASYISSQHHRLMSCIA